MITTEKCQFDFYEDFDVVPEIRVEIDGFDPGRPGNGNGLDPANNYEPWEYETARVIMIVNGTEIELPETTAAKVLKAVKCRLDAKLDDLAAAVFQDAALRAADEIYTEKQLQRDAERILFAKGA